MKLSDVLRRTRRRNPNPFPSPQSVGAAVFERHAKKMHQATRETLEALFAGDRHDVTDRDADFGAMVREHREGLLRRLDGDLRFQDLVDQLQRLELLRELYERDPDLVAFALRSGQGTRREPPTIQLETKEQEAQP